MIDPPETHILVDLSIANQNLRQLLSPLPPAMMGIVELLVARKRACQASIAGARQELVPFLDKRFERF